jgi:hypothetical protein
MPTLTTRLVSSLAFAMRREQAAEGSGRLREASRGHTATCRGGSSRRFARPADFRQANGFACEFGLGSMALVSCPCAHALRLRAQFGNPEFDLERLVLYGDSLNEIPESTLSFGEVGRVP